VIAFRSAAGNFLGQRFIGQQREHGLLVRQFGAETVRHAHGAGAVGLHQRMREIEALQKLLYAHTPVDEVDLIIRPPQYPVPEFELFG